MAHKSVLFLWDSLCRGRQCVKVIFHMTVVYKMPSTKDGPTVAIQGMLTIPYDNFQTWHLLSYSHLDQWFLKRGNSAFQGIFDSVWRYFDCQYKGDPSGIWWVEIRDVVKHPMMYSIVSQHKELSSPNANIGVVEKPPLGMIMLPHLHWKFWDQSRCRNLYFS